MFEKLKSEREGNVCRPSLLRSWSATSHSVSSTVLLAYRAKTLTISPNRQRSLHLPPYLAGRTIHHPLPKILTPSHLQYQIARLFSQALMHPSTATLQANYHSVPPPPTMTESLLHCMNSLSCPKPTHSSMSISREEEQYLVIWENRERC